jgi:serine/threonine protein kinase
MAPSIPSPCLSDNTIADVITGNLALDRVSAIESHIDRCDPCRVLLARAAISGVAALSRDPTGAPHASGARGEGAVVGEGQYAIVREIARGGMGRIVEAWDIRHGRTVALKLLLHDAPLARERFAREVRITALLQHPSVVPLYEAGRFASGEPFFVMKLVSGESLDAAASRATTPLQRMRLVPHLIAVTEAIAYAHDKRVIHRDLKPSNVLVGAFGETVVIDWGLAKHLEVAGDQDASGERSLPGGPEHEALTGAGHAVGTPAYMAPEQARGGVADERARRPTKGSARTPFWRAWSRGRRPTSTPALPRSRPTSWRSSGRRWPATRTIATRMRAPWPTTWRGTPPGSSCPRASTRSRRS